MRKSGSGSTRLAAGGRRWTAGALVAAAAALAVMPGAASATGRATVRDAGARPAATRHVGRHYTIGFILASPVSALIDMGNGVQGEAKRLGMGFDYESASFSSSTQLSAMSSMIARHVSAIITSPLVTKSFETSIEQAKKAGIPVLVYDGSDPGLTMDMTNADYQAAYDMVGYVAKHLRSEHKPCDIALLQGLPVVPALGNRDKGMVAGAKANHCTVLGTQVDTADTLSSAATIADQWKSQFGSKLEAIIPYNDGAALGVVSAVSSSFNPVVVGFNGEPQNVKDVAAGRLWEDYALQNTIMGEGLAWAAYQVLTGHKVPVTVYSPYVLLTKSNAASYKGDTYFLAHPPKSFSIIRYKGQWQLKYSGS